MDQDLDPEAVTVESLGISRRAVLGAGTLAAAAAALGLDFALARPAFAAPPTSAQGIVDYGKSYLGKTISQIKQDPEMNGTSWATYNGEWCAWFLSWISRGLGYGPRFNAPYYDPPNFPEVPAGQARVGDFVRIYNGGSPIHVGIVSAVSGGQITSILDGNRTTVPSWQTTVVRNDRDYSPSVIRRSPHFGSVEYTPTGANMQLVKIIFDQGPNTAPGFASTAVYNPTIGWVQTSEGYGPRDTLNGYDAIAGVLGFAITEKHVDQNGWILSQLFKFPGTRP